MEGNIEKDCTALGALFQHIINDLRGSSPIWEDFTAKATKLHTTLRTTLVAISTFLEAFQKVADMATNTRGATKEIGLALTRLCLRHRSIESKLKSFTGSITEGMVSPIQDKLEEWKKTVAQIDKDHNKECKKARAEIKKAASDTVRLQKKVKKGSSGLTVNTGKDMQQKLDHALQDVHGKFRELEEAEKNSVRKALIEERSRFCLFVSSVKPFVDGEINLLTEVTHLQEIMESLMKHSAAPDRLPQSSEQVLVDLKGADLSTWSLQDNIKHSPPSSPSSMGSRKSSMCSISSLNSSSSGSSKCHSPSHHFRQRSASQSNNTEASSTGDITPTDSTPSTPSEQASTPSASSTWNNWPEQPKGGAAADPTRPHTISTAYERTHTRPPLSATLFEPPVPEIPEKEGAAAMRPHPAGTAVRPLSASSHYARPATINKLQPVMHHLGPKPKASKAVPPPVVPTLEADELPVYVNMNELATMEAEQRQQGERDVDQESDNTPSDTPHPQAQYLQKLQNSLELAEAIRELEASTAALTTAYDQPDASNASRGSLQCSSGYGTMNSTPSGSEDTITTGEMIVTPVEMLCPDREKYFTIPRNSDFLRAYKATLDARRPASTGGIPVTQVGIGTIKRNGKPPPPVRRTSSISGGSGPPAVMQKSRRSPPKGPGNARIILDGQHNMLHRRTLSSGGEQPREVTVNLKHTKSADELESSTHYATPHLTGHGESVQPSSPQYAVPHLVENPGGQTSTVGVPSVAPSGDQSQPVGLAASGIVQSLNAKFAALQQSQQQKLQQQPPQQQTLQQQQQLITQQQAAPQTLPKPQRSAGHQPPLADDRGSLTAQSPIYAELNVTGRGPLQPHHEEAEEDFPDLPPPPSEEELAQINAQLTKGPIDTVRGSLVSELRHGPQLRRTGAIEKTETYQV